MGTSTEELSMEIAETRQSMTANVDALQDKVSPAAIVERRKEAARGRLRGMRDKVMGTAHGVGASTSGTAGSAKESAQEAMESMKGTAQDRIEGTPLAAGLVAFGAGMIVSALIPASEKEAVAAGHVVDAAKEHGQPVVDQAKSMAQEVAQNVKESATDAVQEVKDTATESTQRVKSESQSGEDRSQTQY